MILAAGGGTRLYPLTFATAKPMVPVLNRPVMAHIVALLRRHGVTHLIANLHHHGEQIASYFGDGSQFGVSLEYSREEQILGTAGGARNVASFFGGESFLVIGGDDLADFDLTAMTAFHRERSALATIAVSQVDPGRVSQFGIVVTEDDGRIKSFEEKPQANEAKSRLANTGVYILEPEVLDLVPAGEFFDFGKQVFPLLLERGAPFFAWVAAGYWKDIGNPQEYLEANVDSLDGRAGITAEGEEIAPGVWRDGAAEIVSGAVEGPAVLGAGCRVESAGHVRRPVIGAGARIPGRARLDECVVWDGVDVPEMAARRAIFAPGCVVWA